MSIVQEYDSNKYTAIDITTDNKVVAARGTQLDFHRGSDITHGYKAKFRDNTPITPSKLLLHGKNSNLLMLTPQKRNVLVRVDTETGKNLGELELSFHAEVEEPYDTIVPVKKFSQLRAQDTIQLVGTSRNSVFNLEWDTRTPTDQIVLGDSHKYTKAGRTHQFTSVATTSGGDLVVGDNEGVVRLFSSPAEKTGFKRAKTNLNQLADPVRSVEVSSDGEWVVWTTKSYLAVVNTSFQDKDGRSASGFQKSMGASRPDALILRISPEDMKKNGITEVDFQGARFDNGPYASDSGAIIEEDLIVSTGPFIVKWNFRKVKIEYGKARTGECGLRPSIYKQAGTVVDKAFEYGVSKIVTALETDIEELDLDED